MRKLVVFNLVTLDGYIAGPNGEIDWHNVDDEFQDFTHERLKNKIFDTLIFGRVTYDLMAGFWPSPAALAEDPITAEYMNTTPKIVFSKTLGEVTDGPHWKNVTVFKEIEGEMIQELKNKPGGDIGIFGSSTIIGRFAALNLIDEYQLLLNPIVLGVGKPLFKDFPKTGMRLLETRPFRNGNVFLRYRPKKS